MWSGGDDINDKGESVRLYQPIQYGRKPDQSDPCASFVGGGGQWSDRPTCRVCHDTCYLLSQLHVPSSPQGKGRPGRTYQVFACNRASCWTKMFESGPLCYGGDGVVYCRSVVTTPRISTHEPKQVRVSQQSDTTWAPWTDAPGAKDDDGSWGDAGTEYDGLDALESKLNSMECKEMSTAPPKDTPVAQPQNDKKHKQSPSGNNSFPCFELHSLQEPHARKIEGADDDDVGMGTSGSSDNDKIQQMLARYMAEEDDEGILAALRGASNDEFGGGANSRSGRERDERLSAEDRALLTYTDRLKRSPRQVIRYAYEGMPLWSIPVSQVPESSKRQGKGRVATFKPIPQGPGGENRVFTFQLLPSLLHVLQVDHSGSYGNLGTAFSQGGMNWGNISVFTTTLTTSDGPTDEYVVVQESVDGMPRAHQHIGSTEPVVIADGTDFGVDTEADGEGDDDDDGDGGAEEEMEAEWSDDDA